MFLQLLDEPDQLVLIVWHRNHKIEVRGAPNYTREGYDPADPLHALLDALDAPSVAVLMTGVIYYPNFKNPRTQQSAAPLMRLFLTH